MVRTDILRKYPLLSCSGEIETPLQLTLDALAMQGYRMRWYAQAVCRGGRTFLVAAKHCIRDGRNGEIP